MSEGFGETVEVEYEQRAENTKPHGRRILLERDLDSVRVTDVHWQHETLSHFLPAC